MLRAMIQSLISGSIIVTFQCCHLFFTSQLATSINFPLSSIWVSQVALVVKNLPSNGGDIEDTGLIPRLARFPEGGHGNPLHYSCLENPMDRGDWQATVHGIAKSQT